MNMTWLGMGGPGMGAQLLEVAQELKQGCELAEETYKSHKPEHVVFATKDTASLFRYHMLEQANLLLNVYVDLFRTVEEKLVPKVFEQECCRETKRVAHEKRTILMAKLSQTVPSQGTPITTLSIRPTSYSMTRLVEVAELLQQMEQVLMGMGSTCPEVNKVLDEYLELKYKSLV
jgi:hypothetical protein